MNVVMAQVFGAGQLFIPGIRTFARRSTKKDLKTHSELDRRQLLHRKHICLAESTVGDGGDLADIHASLLTIGIGLKAKVFRRSPVCSLKPRIAENFDTSRIF